MTITRHFVRVGARHVHYRRAGLGPPLVLLHPAMAHSGFFEGMMPRLASRFTVLAFDNAGFGESDPLPIAEVTMADLAEGLSDALAALAMPPVLLFGYHSGAAVAVELAVRHPHQVAGLVVDGMPIFTEAETAALFSGDFAPPLEIDPLGGHFSRTWTRFRDQAAFYPWHDKRPERMLPLRDAASAEKVDTWVGYFFRSAAHYARPFLDAHAYGRIAAARIGQLQVPAAFVVAADDFLVAHADRLPSIGPNERLLRIGADPAEKQSTFDRLFLEMAGAEPAPAPPALPRASTIILRDQLDIDGVSLRVRSCGPANAHALLLLHDLPGSGGAIEPLIADLGRHFRVVAPDLPGCDGSDPLPGAPSVETIADGIDAALRQFGLDRPLVCGIGFGGSFAAHLAARYGGGLVLAGALLPDPATRAVMKARYAPPIAIEPDGAHWFRTWQMLRDQEFHFPWYDRRLATQRGTHPDLDGTRLHARTIALLAQRAGYAQAIHAAFNQDLGATLARTGGPIARIIAPPTPLAGYEDDLAALLPDAQPLPPSGAAVIAWASAALSADAALACASPPGPTPD